MAEKEPKRKSQLEVLSLLVLSKGPNHGYGILKEIKSISEGRLRFTPPSVYDSLNILLANGETTDLEGEIVNGRFRQKYSITDLGKEILAKEMRSLARLLQYHEQDPLSLI